MSTQLAQLLSAAIAYLIGSIPFSLLIAKWFGGIDLRQFGSGNVGATNVARALGARWGALALACDAAKGMIAVGMLPTLVTVPSDQLVHQQVLVAIFAVLGHMFSLFLSLKGGKGVATALGAVILLSPWTTLYALLAFIVAMATTRIVSLSSIVAAVTYAIVQMCLYQSDLWSSKNWSLGTFSTVVPLLIIFRHRANIVRIRQGTESQLTFGRKPSAEGDNSNSQTE